VLTACSAHVLVPLFQLLAGHNTAPHSQLAVYRPGLLSLLLLLLLLLQGKRTMHLCPCSTCISVT
jgi:hypothetical protein